MCSFIVVFVCHTTLSVIGQFLFAAQDADMTSGDYAFFTFTETVTEEFTQPWTACNLTGQNLTYRLQAFYSLKQVIGKTIFVAFR